jgi:hypothetical protein
MSNSNQAGKGDKARPTKKQQFDQNFDRIKWTSNNTNKEVITKKGKTTYKY